MKDFELAIFAGYNSKYPARDSKEELIKVLEKDRKSAIDQFKMNDVIVNLDKFQCYGVLTKISPLSYF